MRKAKSLYWGIATAGIAALLAACAAQMTTRGADPALRIGEDDIGGMVTSPGGPEAGVWVIAETTDLPTRYIKSVVTDDRGRYVIPDLPVANYQVFVRGYGLVDSPRVRARPGQIVNLAAVPAPDERAAALLWLRLGKPLPLQPTGAR